MKYWYLIFYIHFVCNLHQVKKKIRGPHEPVPLHGGKFIINCIYFVSGPIKNIITDSYRYLSCNYSLCLNCFHLLAQKPNFEKKFYLFKQILS